MNKIKEAQELADKMLDECSCRQVGDDKGALKDIPEELAKSQKDIEKAVAMKEEKEIKVSDVPKDKRKIFKIRRGLARIKGGKLKESNLVKIAQNKDTLFDDNDGITKDSDKLKPSLNPEPTTESKKKVTGYDLFKLRRGLARNKRNEKMKKVVKTEGWLDPKKLTPKQQAAAKAKIKNKKPGFIKRLAAAWIKKRRKKGTILVKGGDEPRTPKE